MRPEQTAQLLPSQIPQNRVNGIDWCRVVVTQVSLEVRSLAHGLCLSNSHP